MPNTALVTGASSGIGRELARLHAGKGGDLVITARRGEALEALKAELESAHGIAVHCIALDLGAPDGAARLAAAVDALGLEIEVLINNAGFGGHGAFLERELAQDLAMIDLNVKALVSLSHHFGRQMVARGRGRMLQVASTAGLIPGPMQATYFATKAFVTSFSLAIDEEMREHGVTSTVLAPGPVETEFFETASLDGTSLGKGAASAATVARVGYNAMRAGQLHVIDSGQLSFLLNWVTPFLPRRTVLKMVRRMQTKTA